MSDTSSTSQQRLLFIDIARSLGIVLALLAHALSTYGVSRAYPETYPFTQLVTIAATPLFIFMFGFMLEFVYVPRVKREGLRGVAARLTIRSVQCYLAYAAITISALLGGTLDLHGVVDALIFMGDSKYGNILRIYVVTLMLFIPLLVARMHLGRGLWFILLISVYGSFFWLETLEKYSYGSFAHTANMLFGVGPVERGPSVWHALAFVFAGAFVAANVTRSVTYRPAFLASCGVVIVALGIVVALGHHDPAEETLRKLVFGHYRAHNMFEYYALATIYCVGILVTLSFGSERLMKWISNRNSFIALGKSSLLSFMVGNIMLNLTLKVASNHIHPLIGLVGFFTLLTFLIYYHKLIPGYSTIKRGVSFGT